MSLTNYILIVLLLLCTNSVLGQEGAPPPPQRPLPAHASDPDPIPWEYRSRMGGELRVKKNAIDEYFKGQIALDEHKVPEAIVHLEDALKLSAKFEDAEILLGIAYQEAGKFDDAERVLSHISIVAAGGIYLNRNEYDKAEETFKKALEKDPKAFNTSFALGELYLRLKRYNEAEKRLQQGLAIDGKSSRAHYILANVFWEEAASAKEDGEAKPLLEKSYREVKEALDLDPTSAGAHLLKGNLYLRVSRAEDAMREYYEYLRLDPKGQFADQTRVLVEKIKQALAEPKRP